MFKIFIMVDIREASVFEKFKFLRLSRIVRKGFSFSRNRTDFFRVVKEYLGSILRLKEKFVKLFVVVF